MIFRIIKCAVKTHGAYLPKGVFMKKTRRILIVLLTLALAFTLFACGKKTTEEPPPAVEENKPCESHVDKDKNGACDKCGEDFREEVTPPASEDVTLVKDGDVLYDVVIGGDVDEATRAAISALSEKVTALGGEIKIYEDSETAEKSELEILVGTVTSRGEEYAFDRIALGYSGWAIESLDGKIVVTGGSDEALLECFTEFTEDYLGIKEDTETLSDAKVKKSKFKTEIFDNYRVYEILVGKNDVKDYVIACDVNDPVYFAAAKRVRDFLWGKAGYYLDVVDINTDSYGNAIKLSHTEKGMAGATGFRARVVGDDFLIECAHRTGLDKALSEFFSNFVQARDSLELKNYSGETDITRIYYSDFGVVGDGITNDTEAIRAAHEAANLDNLTVMGEAGKIYYIARVETPIAIMTDVDWQGAKFIFDASNFTKADTGNVFQVKSHISSPNVSKQYIDAINANKDEYGYVIKGLSHGDEQTTKLDLGLGFPALLKIYNTNNKTYMRWGYVDNAGQNQCEVVLVDEYGNIDPSTPILLDYTALTSINVIRVDIPTVTIKNATIESIASQNNTLGAGGSIAHSIALTRPNIVFQNVHHVISGEIAKNAPTRLNEETGLWEDVTAEGFSYDSSLKKILLNGAIYTGDDVQPFIGYTYSGFVQCRDAHNILVKGCTFQARVYYNEGTYDISSTFTNKVIFEDCVQSNFFDTRPEYEKYGPSTVANLSLCWGIAGTNFCKNLDYINCELTRYDAHCGVVNGRIIGGKIAVVRLIGGGNFTVEGVEFYQRSGAPIQLREDYGASFNGTLTIKDCKFNYGWKSQLGHVSYAMTLISAGSAQWDNNYTTYFPNIIIDGITVETTQKNIILIGPSARSYPTSHYPLRDITKDDVSNPNAEFLTCYETKNPNIVTQKPEKFPHLAGFKKVNKSYNALAFGEYTVVDNGNGTYTVIAMAKNINPYTPPSFIEIKNMATQINEKGESFNLIVYDCPFLAETEIIDNDGLVSRPKP